jgi:hypothetical protein
MIARMPEVRRTSATIPIRLMVESKGFQLK